MTTTGYFDTFNRTVANGLGPAESGQAYGINGTASGYSVAPGTASIAITQAGNIYGVVDALSGLFVDISGQVALSAVPATNLATVGFIARGADNANWYNATMMVATGGAMSIRFSKLVAGSMNTLSTVSLGTTYVAGTFYNLRFQCYWSRALQANVLQAKLWAVGATEPGGWTATFNTDASFTDYTGGGRLGIVGRDESTTLGTITARFKSVSTRSYLLPMPASADPMCADPAVTYPKQTALQSLASAVDVATATIDPLTSLAGMFPRVRVSNTNLLIVTSQLFIPISYTATEFNIGTPTNLGYNPNVIYLPQGVWFISFEMVLANAGSSYLTGFFTGGPSVGQVETEMRASLSQSNDQGVGGTCHASTVTYSTDPVTPIQIGFTLNPNILTTTYTAKYAALSAIKISDYFA